MHTVQTDNGIYDWNAIESRWQSEWAESDAFKTPDPDDSRNDCYVFTAYPFTSGGAHIGHMRSYTIADTYARFRRAQGDAVLFSIAFESFGLPTEIEAVKHGIPPHEWAERCISLMREQFSKMGFSFDWERSFCHLGRGHLPMDPVALSDPTRARPSVLSG